MDANNRGGGRAKTARVSVLAPRRTYGRVCPIWPFRRRAKETALERPSTVAEEPVSEKLSFRVEAAAEAKQAIKELKLKKKELALQKKAVNAEMAIIRAERRAQLASQGSKMRGGGKTGNFIRDMQTMSRDVERSRHANRLAPIESRKARIEGDVLALDSAIAQLERYLLERNQDG